MVEFIGSDSGKFSSEFVNNKFISFVAIIVVENHRVAKVHGVRPSSMLVSWLSF